MLAEDLTSGDSRPRKLPSRPLIIIPAWNEQDAITATLRDVWATLPSSYAVIVVDDGSTDSTAAVARAAGAQVLSLPYNLGLGGALRVGFKYALSHGHDAVVQLDADGQHRPQDVPELLSGLAQHDLVIGSRFHGTDYTVSGPRAWAMRLLSTALSRMARTRLSDPTSGLRAIGPDLLPLFAEYYPVDYLENVEATIMALRNNFTVTERQVTMRARQAGNPSQNNLKLVLHMLRTLLILSLSMIRRWPAPPRKAAPAIPVQRVS